MTKYLLLKLAEEPGEVVVTAIKHRIHNSPATRDRLEQEVGDVMAMVKLLIEKRSMSYDRISTHTKSRYHREVKRMGR